ncbi:HoxN/HupN/NixA family nickel/cobalt transporter [Blastococcus jejuensis]|uniref:Nickel/cobalt efflux system n=1 Tax=Blastococcus jejuensis TaxID=351224 RepID=A0ABP6P7M4_9ACTN
MAVATPPLTTPAAPRLDRRDRGELAVLLGIVAVMTAAGWTLLAAVVVPQQLDLGGQVFGLGLGVTAYVLGVRHAFDADHIAAIDNTTRRLLAEGRRPLSAGFWFALGHSTVVAVLATAVALGARSVTALADDGSGVRQGLGVLGAGVSGLFLYLIGALNLVALIGLLRHYRSSRAGRADPAALEEFLERRGLYNRLLRPLMRSIHHPAQLFPVGLLFGIGFDTATEVTLLALAGTGAAAGLPWYAVLVLPLLFTAGMTLFDTLDGAFMIVAYRWAFAEPVRKLFYNLTITGLSVAVALLIGTVQLVGMLHDRLRWRDPVTGWIAGLDLNTVGFLVVGLFAVVWAAAAAYWKVSGGNGRRQPARGRVRP